MSENQIFNSENIKSKVLGTFGSSSGCTWEECCWGSIH